MKTKFKFLMAVAILAAGFTSCNKDDSESGGGEYGKSTHMILRISEAKTYATTDDNAKDEEAKVNEVYIVQYDHNGVYLTSSKHDLSTLTPTPGTNGEEYVLTVDSYTATKQILAGVNLTDDIIAQIPYSIYDMGTNSNPVYKLTGGNNFDDGFAMFSSKLIKDLDIKENPASGENEVSIQVERMVAKIDLQKGSSLNDTDVSNTTISSNLDFAMGAINTKTYPMRRDDKKDPNFEDSKYNEWYLKGQFYYEFLNNQPTTTDDFGFANILDAAYVSINPNQGNNPYEDIKEGRNVKYVPENTAEVPRQGISTYTSIRTKFVPDYLNDWNSTDGITEDVSYIKGTSNVPDDLYVQMDQYGKYYFFTNKTVAKEAFEDENGVGPEPLHYEHGYCYYTVFLNHQNDGNTYRNDMYLISVTKINQLGNPNPGEPDPGEPIVKVATEIDVTIEVLYWNVVASDEELSK